MQETCQNAVGQIKEQLKFDKKQQMEVRMRQLEIRYSLSQVQAHKDQ